MHDPLWFLDYHNTVFLPYCKDPVRRFGHFAFLIMRYFSVLLLEIYKITRLYKKCPFTLCIDGCPGNIFFPPHNMRLGLLNQPPVTTTSILDGLIVCHAVNVFAFHCCAWSTVVLLSTDLSKMRQRGIPYNLKRTSTETLKD